MRYDDYMRSRWWKRLRRQALARDVTCRGCDTSDRLEVHHRRYPPKNRWREDTLEAVTVLCRDCHRAITESMAARRHEPWMPSLEDERRVTPASEVQRERLSEPELPDHRGGAAAAAQRPAG